MIELIGSIPALDTLISTDITWLKDQLSNVKEEIRELVAILYSLIVGRFSSADFDVVVNTLIGKLKFYHRQQKTWWIFTEQTAKNNLEAQHGASLAIGCCVEAYALKLRRENVIFDKQSVVKECVHVLGKFLYRVIV